MLPLSVDGTHFIDTEGRTVLLRGINLSGDAKLPKSPDVPSHVSEGFWNADNVSFVGRPFELEDADEHLGRISSWGYNVVRFIITWEAVEHTGPGIYDEEYIIYIIALLRKCATHGLYVLMDPHQDVWSRYSGGSGAPFWTYIAAGMDPSKFRVTESAVVHNTAPNPEDFPKMIWSTNYDRMATATMFILFFAGRHFAHKAIINGKNIQDFLQSHFMHAMAHVAKRINHAGGLEGTVVMGWETMNEPSQSWIGIQDLSRIPADQHLRKGTCPSPFQAIALASGLAQDVQVWDFGALGPKKVGTKRIDPQGSSIWFDNSFDDGRYGWSRDKDWTLGTCIWEQHGVWDRVSGSLTKPNYFETAPGGDRLDSAAFLKVFWMPHLREYKDAIRSVHASAIIFCQPPVLKVPPIFSAEDKEDKQIVYSPHFYDGLTLMNKTWCSKILQYTLSIDDTRNKWYNVDVLGVLRGRYLSPMFAVKLGTRAIRNCLRDQLIAIKAEGLQNLGPYPCFISEIGIPFDMNNGRAYRSGDYSSQISALDANHYALEGSLNNYCLWHYSGLNTHKLGDFWNGEDLSLYSNTDCIRSIQQSPRPIPLELRETKSTSWFPPLDEPELDVRGRQASCRPSPIRIGGELTSYSFDLAAQRFEMCILTNPVLDHRDHPTEIFLPVRHFKNPDIRVTDGRTEYHEAGQILLWWPSLNSAPRRMHLVVNGR